jgi:processing peptidase subunit beta
VALAFQGASWTSEYSFPLMVMQQILGSWNRASAVGRNVSSRSVSLALVMYICDHSMCSTSLGE